ncbi:hypothetical protein M405DRAFT_15315 [Rhizopogon salebrosus TDB-379]|nr:hypothetical protein M405DRAFT_15315 [Rhizopogon salebrosus TDB-379]
MSSSSLTCFSARSDSHLPSALRLCPCIRRVLSAIFTSDAPPTLSPPSRSVSALLHALQPLSTLMHHLHLSAPLGVSHSPAQYCRHLMRSSPPSHVALPAIKDILANIRPSFRPPW